MKCAFTKMLPVITLFVSVALLFSSFAIADFTQPEWKHGDYWKYSETYYPSEEQDTKWWNATICEKVIGLENITVNGVLYNALKVKIIRFPSGTDGKNETGFSYYRSSDFAQIKFVATSNYTTLLESPWDRWDYPIQVGERWEKQINWTNILPFDKNRRETNNYNFSYKCTGKTEVSVKAGTFSCYIVKEQLNLSEDNYGLYYLSPAVGREVKMKSYQNGNLQSEKELLSFSYHGRTSEDENEEGFIPGFDVLSLLGGMSIAAILILQKVSKK